MASLESAFSGELPQILFSRSLVNDLLIRVVEVALFLAGYPFSPSLESPFLGKLCQFVFSRNLVNDLLIRVFEAQWSRLDIDGGPLITQAGFRNLRSWVSYMK